MPIENNRVVQYILHMLRKIHLVDLPDYARFAVRCAKTRASNKAFLQENPEFIPPSLWRMYEAYAHSNYQTYFRMGMDTAVFLVDQIKKHSMSEALSILEWGCGPARVIRHFPNLLGTRKKRIVGADYNAESIEYCKKSLTRIEFIRNELEPPIGFDDSTFDVIYAISVEPLAETKKLLN